MNWFKFTHTSLSSQKFWKIRFRFRRIVSGQLGYQTAVSRQRRYTAYLSKTAILVCENTNHSGSRWKARPFSQDRSCPALRREPCACRKRRCSHRASGRRRLWFGSHRVHAAAAARAQRSWSSPDVSARLFTHTQPTPHSVGSMAKQQQQQQQQQQH